MDNGTSSLGVELKKIRLLRKLSLRNVEAEIGVSNAYLSQLENDKIQKPSPRFLYKLANLYDVDYHLLMEHAGYAGPKKDTTGPKTLAGAALFSTKDLTPEEEEELVNYLNFLRSRNK